MSYREFTDDVYSELRKMGANVLSLSMSQSKASGHLEKARLAVFENGCLTKGITAS